MASKLVFRDKGLYQLAGTNLRAKTCITVDLIDRTGQGVFSSDIVAVAGSQHSLERRPPLLQGAETLTLRKRRFRHFCDFFCALLESAWRGGQESADAVDMKN
ncbi:hypothetical protein Y032_0678g1452 [Ancylostoma ceylanicum]|uniref:Uncharacterized protein n=1 Tax=Ancylostoma ceylanicum TaxID=53326 RepID=A0A016WHH8_9BILA|nr:hypothetical protein Y032_0678g1452 [Ancylostoma ceylanicum]